MSTTGSKSLSQLALSAAVVFSGHAAHAQDGLRIGVGALSCSEYLNVMSSKSDASKAIVISWVQGYLMGMNTVQMSLAPERGMKSIPDSEALQAHLLLYCKTEPLGKVIRGTTALFPSLPNATR